MKPSTSFKIACGYFLLLSCYDMFEPAQIVELAGQVPAQYKNDTALRFLMEEAQKSGKTANGTSFIDVIIPSIDGGELKLSDIVKQNKLTLVDCWASWCGPCRAEMPHVVELYAKYHEKGLEIVGISFDEEEDVAEWNVIDANNDGRKWNIYVKDGWAVIMTVNPTEAADDYLVKPFSPRELVARVRALLRRASMNGAEPRTEAPRAGENPAERGLFSFRAKASRGRSRSRRQARYMLSKRNSTDTEGLRG